VAGSQAVLASEAVGTAAIPPGGTIFGAVIGRGITIGITIGAPTGARPRLAAPL
jgi:hypothetical protein